jgi:hypothetical protein
MKEKNRKKILDLIKTLAAVALAVIIGLIFFAPHAHVEAKAKPVYAVESSRCPRR